MKRIIALALLIGSAIACQGTRPKNLGVTEGTFSSCPDKPNCVSSQASNDKQKVPPLPLKGNANESIDRLVQVIKAMGKAKVVEKRDNYLYVEFESSLLRYVDDVEFFASEKTGEIEVRSASRLGYSDLGVNRKRIESIRAVY